MESNSLLLVPFTTLSDYLFYLREFAKLLSKVSAKVMFYLAAAVSDFYVPEERMVSCTCACVCMCQVNSTATGIWCRSAAA